MRRQGEESESADNASPTQAHAHTLSPALKRLRLLRFILSSLTCGNKVWCGVVCVCVCACACVCVGVGVGGAGFALGREHYCRQGACVRAPLPPPPPNLNSVVLPPPILLLAIIINTSPTYLLLADAHLNQLFFFQLRRCQAKVSNRVTGEGMGNSECRLSKQWLTDSR